MKARTPLSIDNRLPDARRFRQPQIERVPNPACYEYGVVGDWMTWWHSAKLRPVPGMRDCRSGRPNSGSPWHMATGRGRAGEDDVPVPITQRCPLWSFRHLYQHRLRRVTRPALCLHVASRSALLWVLVPALRVGRDCHPPESIAATPAGTNGGAPLSSNSASPPPQLHSPPTALTRLAASVLSFTRCPSPPASDVRRFKQNRPFPSQSRRQTVPGG